MARPVVYIVLYSLYQHVYKLSLAIQQGLEEKDVQVKIFQVAETLSDEILSKMQAPIKPDLPIITVDRLAEPDGIIFGLPTRFGLFPAQIKTLLDASGALWAKGALAGKFAGTFFSTASQHGGQETTALTAVTYFAHHGMMYVPFGYANVALQNNSEVIGGSAYGAGTISDGDGSRQPSQVELDIARNQGQNFGIIVSTFVKGKNAIEGTKPVLNNKAAGNNTANSALSGAVESTDGNTGVNTAGAVGAGAVGAGAVGAAAGRNSTSNTTGDIPNKTLGSSSATPINSLNENNGSTTPAHGGPNQRNGFGNTAPTDSMNDIPSTPTRSTAGNVTSNNATDATDTINATNATDAINATNATSTANATNATSAPNANNTNSATTKDLNAVTTPSANTTKDAAKVGTAEEVTATNKNTNSDGPVATATADNSNTKVADTTNNATVSKKGASAGVTAAGAANAVPNKLKDNKPKKKKKWFCC